MHLMLTPPGNCQSSETETAAFNDREVWIRRKNRRAGRIRHTEELTLATRGACSAASRPSNIRCRKAQRCPCHHASVPSPRCGKTHKTVKEKHHFLEWYNEWQGRSPEDVDSEHVLWVRRGAPEVGKSCHCIPRDICWLWKTGLTLQA